MRRGQAGNSRNKFTSSTCAVQPPLRLTTLYVIYEQRKSQGRTNGTETFERREIDEGLKERQRNGESTRKRENEGVVAAPSLATATPFDWAVQA